MDFKDRNPIPLFSNSELEAYRQPMAFRGFLCANIIEMDAPDGSTVFLGINGGFSPDEVTLIEYFAEAHPSCPMRLAFEKGDVSWSDYWGSRPWLLEVSFDLTCPSVYRIRYIVPHEMQPGACNMIKNLNGQRPYEISKEYLSFLLKVSENNVRELAEARALYQKFMVEYDQVFGKAAA